MNKQCKWCNKLVPRLELLSVAVVGGYHMICKDCFRESDNSMWRIKMSNEQEACKICGRAKSYYHVKTNRMACKLDHDDNCILDKDVFTPLDFRTTAVMARIPIMIEINDYLANELPDVAIAARIRRVLASVDGQSDMMREMANIIKVLVSQNEEINKTLTNMYQTSTRPMMFSKDSGRMYNAQYVVALIR